nr:MAG TPA: hypothetical protein [Bacteriophage sp.]
MVIRQKKILPLHDYKISLQSIYEPFANCSV